MDINNHWKTIIDTLSEGLIVVDSAGDIVAINPAAERLTGYSSDELLGKSCRILNCSGCNIYNKVTPAGWPWSVTPSLGVESCGAASLPRVRRKIKSA